METSSMPVTTSLVGHISEPPRYSSQFNETSPIQSPESRSIASNDDLVSARSQPLPSPTRPVDVNDNPQPSDVHFHDTVPLQQATPRRRYTSLPYNGSATLPQQLRYHYVRGTISTNAPTELGQDAHPSLIGQTVPSKSTIRLNPTNFVSLSRKSTVRRRAFSIYRTSASITGDYTVNPYLHVPAALLSQASFSARDETIRYRKNLRFAVENGGIDVNIYLVGDPASNEGSDTLRTTLDLKIKGCEGTTFPLIAKIHTPELPRPPFYLLASGINGYHAIHIPPSFHGLVTISVTAGDLDTHISLSREFSANATILNETANARSYFVGELGGWARDKQGWEGDRVDVGVVRGMVRLQFVGEKGRDGLRRFQWNLGLGF